MGIEGEEIRRAVKTRNNIRDNNDGPTEEKRKREKTREKKTKDGEVLHEER